MTCELRPETGRSWSGDRRREGRRCRSPEAGACLACVKNSEVAGAAAGDEGVGGEGRGSVGPITARRELSLLQEERPRVREATSPRSPGRIKEVARPIE